MEQLIGELNLPSFLMKDVEVGSIDLEELEFDDILSPDSTGADANADLLREAPWQGTSQRALATVDTTLMFDHSENACSASSKAPKSPLVAPDLGCINHHIATTAPITPTKSMNNTTVEIPRAAAHQVSRYLHETMQSSDATMLSVKSLLIERGHGLDTQAVAPSVFPHEDISSLPADDIDDSLTLVPMSQEEISNMFEIDNILNQLMPTSLISADNTRLRNALSAVCIAYRQTELLRRHSDAKYSELLHQFQSLQSANYVAETKLRDERERSGYLMHLIERIAEEQNLQSLPKVSESDSEASLTRWLPSLQLLRGEALSAASDEIDRVRAELLAAQQRCEALATKLQESAMFHRTSYTSLKREVQQLNVRLAQGTSLLDAKIKDAESRAQENVNIASKSEQIALRLQADLAAAKGQVQHLEVALQQTLSNANAVKERLVFAEEAINVLKSELESREGLLAHSHQHAEELEKQLKYERTKPMNIFSHDTNASTKPSHSASDGVNTDEAVIVGLLENNNHETPQPQHVNQKLLLLEQQVSMLNDALQHLQEDNGYEGVLQQLADEVHRLHDENAMLRSRLEASAANTTAALRQPVSDRHQPHDLLHVSSLDVSAISFVSEATFSDLRETLQGLQEQLQQEQDVFDSRLAQRERAMRLEYEAKLALQSYSKRFGQGDVEKSAMSNEYTARLDAKQGENEQKHSIEKEIMTESLVDAGYSGEGAAAAALLGVEEIDWADLALADTPR